MTNIQKLEGTIESVENNPYLCPSVVDELREVLESFKAELSVREADAKSIKYLLRSMAS